MRVKNFENKINIVVIFSLIIVIYSLIYFLYLNSLFVNEKFKDYMELIITFIGTIGTITAAIVAYLSVREAKNTSKINESLFKMQKEDSERKYTPILLILDKEFNVTFKKGDKFNLNWDDRNINLTDKLFSKKVNLDLINVGQGFASDLIIEWEIQGVEEFIDATKLKNPLSNNFFDYLEAEFSEDKFKKNRGKMLYVSSVFENRVDSVKDFLYEKLPSQTISFIPNNGGKVTIDIPNIFVVCINILILKGTKLDGIIFPHLKAKIYFKDSNEKLNEANFTINVWDFHAKYDLFNGNDITSNIRLISKKG